MPARFCGPPISCSWCPVTFMDERNRRRCRRGFASDILKNRSKSEFYRTGPGQFFLRAFQANRSIPVRYRREYYAPLRAAQLGRFDVIAFPRAALAEFASRMPTSFPANLLATLPLRSLRLWGLRTDANHVPFRFHLLLLAEEGIMVDDQVPTEDGDMAHRSVLGLPGVVKRSDRSLFSTDEFGLVEAASRTLLERFELPGHVPARAGRRKSLVRSQGLG